MLHVSNCFCMNQIFDHLSGQNVSSSLEMVFDFVRQPLVLLDQDFHVLKANTSFYSSFQLNTEKIRGKLLTDLKSGLFNDGRLVDLLRELLSEDVSAGKKEVVCPGMAGAEKAFRFEARKLSSNKEEQLLLLSVEEVSDQEELLKSSSRYPGFLKQVLDTLPLGVWITDADARIVFTNPMAKTILGGQAPLVDSVEEYTTYRSWWPHTGKALLPEEYPLVRVIRERKPVINSVFCIDRFDGSWGYFSTSAAPILDHHGDLKGAVAFCLDISDQKAAEKELENERELLRTIFETIPVMLTLYEPSINLLHLNKAFYDVTGWTEEDIRNGDTMELVYPDPQYRKQIADYMQSLAPGFKDILMAGKNGEYIESSWANVRIPDGRQVGIGLDIRERKHAEQALRESEERFAGAFRESPYPQAITDLESGIIADVNDAWVSFSGYSRKEAIGKKSLELGILDAGERQQAIEKVRKDGSLKDFEINFHTRRGEQRQVLVNVQTMKLDQRRLLLITLNDVTAAKQARQELERLLEVNRSQKDFLQTLLNSTKACIAVLDGEELRYSMVNKAYQELRPDFPMMGRRFREAFPGVVDAGTEAIFLEVLRTGKSKEERGGFIPIPGISEAVWDYQVVHLPEGKENKSSVLVIAWDTTEHKRLENELRQYTEELATANREMESFSYSVSHDLRTPLLTISSFAGFLKEDYAGALDEEGLDYLQRIENGVQKMHQLINDMLLLSRIGRQEMESGRADLSSMAQRILEELSQKEPQREVKYTIQPGLVASPADARLIQPALENLLGNAWKFTAHNPNPLIEFGCQKQNGLAVYFVRDNGVGFDMKYARQIFDPFKRVHDQKDFAGSGVGLSIVQRVIKRHGGSVWAQSQPGEGTTLFFTLGKKRTQE